MYDYNWKLHFCLKRESVVKEKACLKSKGKTHETFSFSNFMVISKFLIF